MRRFATVMATAIGALVVTAPAQAITFGQFDGDLHPYAGAMVVDWDPDLRGRTSGAVAR